MLLRSVNISFKKPFLEDQKEKYYIFMNLFYAIAHSKRPPLGGHI